MSDLTVSYTIHHMNCFQQITCLAFFPIVTRFVFCFQFVHDWHVTWSTWKVTHEWHVLSHDFHMINILCTAVSWSTCQRYCHTRSSKSPECLSHVIWCFQQLSHGWPATVTWLTACTQWSAWSVTLVYTVVWVWAIMIEWSIADHPTLDPLFTLDTVVATQQEFLEGQLECLVEHGVDDWVQGARNVTQPVEGGEQRRLNPTVLTQRSHNVENEERCPAHYKDYEHYPNHFRSLLLCMDVV